MRALSSAVSTICLLAVSTGLTKVWAQSHPDSLDCVREFNEVARRLQGTSSSQSITKALQDLSPKDEKRIRSLIERLEAAGVPREKILTELRRGDVCGR